MYMEEDYTEQTLEAVRDNMEYLNSFNEEEKLDFVGFLEGVAESMEGGEVLEELAKALRDEIEGEF